MTSLTALAETPEDLVSAALKADSQESKAAIIALRELGYEGLDALRSANKGLIDAYMSGSADPEKWARFSKATDSVAGQKDAWASGLFWYTDLGAALSEARRSKKPVLSLRLLGRLDEELSCANSRFFRSVLYTDPSVSGYLREHYILHWKTVRPAPKITIDFGDGRKLVRTITGNSIHYILDSDGKIVDALPGLYSPVSFYEYLRSSSEFVSGGENSPDQIAGRWFNSRTSLLDQRKNAAPAVKRGEILPGSAAPDGTPIALDVARIAVTKMVVETPTLRKLDLSTDLLRPEPDLEQLRTIASSRPRARLSPESAAFVGMKSGMSGAEFESLRSRLEEFISIDTAQNEYYLHPFLYSMLLIEQPTDLEAFNSLVYDRVFLTPDSDKWLGLYSGDVYAAIDGNGVVSK